VFSSIRTSQFCNYHHGYYLHSSEFRVQSSEFRVSRERGGMYPPTRVDLRRTSAPSKNHRVISFRVQSSEFRVQSSEFRVQHHTSLPRTLRRRLQVLRRRLQVPTPAQAPAPTLWCSLPRTHPGADGGAGIKRTGADAGAVTPAPTHRRRHTGADTRRRHTGADTRRQAGADRPAPTGRRRRRRQQHTKETDHSYDTWQLAS